MNVLDKSAGKDPVNNPHHYTAYGIECIDFSRHMHSAQAQAFQYIWRADLKGEPIQDLEKAVFWLNDWSNGPYCGVYDLRHTTPANFADVPAYYALPIVEVAGHFSYNLGRALELIIDGQVSDAIALVARELVARELQRRKASVEVAPVPASTRSKRSVGRS